MRKLILAASIAVCLASCSKETEETLAPQDKTRFVRAEDGDVSFTFKSETLKRGDVINYEFDGVAYQLNAGTNEATVTNIIYQ
jgi:hypothetical protein